MTYLLIKLIKLYTQAYMYCRRSSITVFLFFYFIYFAKTMYRQSWRNNKLTTDNWRRVRQKGKTDNKTKTIE